MPTMRDLRAAEARWREVHANVDAIGQALDAWNQRYNTRLADLASGWNRSYSVIGQAVDAWNQRYSAQLADLARTSNVIGQALDARNQRLRAQLQTNAIGQALDAWNRNFSGQLTDLARVQLRVDSITQALNAYVRRFDLVVEQIPVATGTEQDAVGATDVLVIPPRGVDWPPFGQIALRALLLTVFVLLSAALWEEKQDSAPAEAIAEILSLLAIWEAVDHWIWRRLS